MNISVSALVPELTDDYDERTSLSSYRLAVGNVLGFCSLMVMTQMLSTYSAADKIAGFRDSASVVAAIMACLGLTCFVLIREKFVHKPQQEFVERPPVSTNSTPKKKKKKNEFFEMMEDDAADGTPTRQRKASSIVMDDHKFKDELKLVLDNKAFLWLSGIWLCGPTALFVLQSR
jgi:Na+/melibiose symporter-like transporter